MISKVNDDLSNLLIQESLLKNNDNINLKEAVGFYKRRS
jgi:hypothetical protein